LNDESKLSEKSFEIQNLTYLRSKHRTSANLSQKWLE